MTVPAPLPSPQVKQNLLNVSYHIAQYASIIADLRGEIKRLKCKIDKQGGRGQAHGRLERGDICHIQGVCGGVCVSGSPSPEARPGRLKLLMGQAGPGSKLDSDSFWLGSLGLVINHSEPSVLPLSNGITISASETRPEG